MRFEDLVIRAKIMEESGCIKFTVNQIVILQKLKQSGLNKDQIIKGLDEIEKLEDIATGTQCIRTTPQPLAVVNSPTDVQCPTACRPNSGGSVPQTSRENDSQRNTTSPLSPRPPRFNHSGILHTLGQPNPLMFGAHLQNHNHLSLLPPVGAWPNTSQAVAVATAASLLHNGFAHGTMPHSIYPNLIQNRGLVRSNNCGGGTTLIDVDDEKVDITEELEELFHRDQASVKEDIRKFISERHISQSAIAKATKNAISQSYISQWLAQPQDISGQKKKAMYTWYLTERRKPVHGTIPQALPYRGSDVDQDAVNPILLRAKRGARFTWPKECLAVLENYYNTNSYPDECKREEIAHACNTIIQAQKPGMMMSDLDRVTTVKVYNWFANRRKDDKRRRHIEHVESLHSHHPTSPRKNSSPTPSCHSSDSNQDGGPSMLNHNQVPPVIKKEDPMAIALEMAAVNNSILSLVGHRQSPSNDDDDDDHDTFGGGQERAPSFHQRPERLITECKSFAG